MKKSIVSLLMSSLLIAVPAAADTSGYLEPGETMVGSVRTAADQIRIDGERGVDIDCWLLDADGDVVDSDTDSGRVGHICLLDVPYAGRFRLMIRNQSRIRGTTWEASFLSGS